MDTREKILKNAKDLFMKKGYGAVNMELIAGSSGLSRRTLYRYFKSREQLAFLVVINILSDFNSFYTELFTKLEGNGITRLESFLHEIISHIGKNLDVMKFFGEFDFTFDDKNEKEPDSRIMNQFYNVSLRPEKIIGEIITSGIDDGSIDDTINADLTVATITNVLWSFGQRIAIRSEHIKNEVHIDAFDLIRHQAALYIKALKKG